MPHEPSDFENLITRVRGGDEQAAAELVSSYESHVRRVIRVRMTDPKLRRLVDSVDICQSVMADFFVRAALGQFQLDAPEQLIKLLATMARNRLINHVEHERAQRRDVGRLGNVAVDETPMAAADATPSRIVAARELLQEVRTRLSDEERYLADQRALGRSWAEIAADVGGQADALRMRLARALDRIAGELNLLPSVEE